MADLDSRSKRASSVQFSLPFLLDLVLPDAALSQGDRQQSVWDYSGILAGGGVVVTGALLAFSSASLTRLVSGTVVVTALAVAAATRAKLVVGSAPVTLLETRSVDRTKLAVSAATLGI